MVTDDSNHQRLLGDLRSVAAPIVVDAPLSPEVRSKRCQAFVVNMRELLSRHSVETDVLYRVYRTSSYDKAIRLGGLYGALHLFRRQENFRAYRELVDEAQPDLGTHPLFSTFYTFYHQSRGDLRVALRYSMQALDYLPTMPGVQHLHAVIVADMLDRSMPVDPEDIKKAMREAKSIIDQPDGRIAAYHTTLARLQYHKQLFEDARTNITLALDIESPDEPGYPLRHANRLIVKWLIDAGQQQSILISELRTSLADVRTSNVNLADKNKELMRKQGQVDSQMAAVRDEVSRMRDQSLTLLTLMTAVITFIVTTVQVSSELGLTSLMVVIPMLALLTVTVFSAGALILGINRDDWTTRLFLGSLSASILAALLSFFVDLSPSG